MATPPVSISEGLDCEVQNGSPESSDPACSFVLFVPVHYVSIPNSIPNRPMVRKKQFYKLLRELGGDPGGERFSSYFVPPATHPGDPYGYNLDCGHVYR